MKSIIFVSLALSVFESQLKSDVKWINFKDKFNKSYLNINDEIKRYNIYKARDEKIRKHNENFLRGEIQYSMGHNQFSDMTKEELKKIYLNPITPKLEDFDVFVSNKSFPQAPASLSYKGNCLPPLNQGQCGSCWAFAATAQTEAQISLKKNWKNYLSPQYVLDCSGGGTCGGGDSNSAINYMKTYGGVYHSDYPYYARDQTCNTGPKRYDLGIKYCLNSYLGGNEEAMKEVLAKNGPVIIYVYIADSFFQYNSGVYWDGNCESSCRTISHAMLLVGYGSDSYDYWLVKNSWGPNWGESGYIRMVRNWKNNCNVACYGIGALM